MKLLLWLAAASFVVASPSLAEDAGEKVWHLYHGDDPAATLAVMEAAEVDSDEPYWSLSLSCSFDQPWELTVSDVDERALGETIADGGPVTFSFVVDGNADGPLGGYFPTLRFGEMFGEWEYSVPLDLDMLGAMEAAGTLAVTGTGVDLPLPETGMKEAIGEFRALCEGYQKMGEEMPKGGNP